MYVISAMEVPYINWMRSISVYESPSHIYLVGSDVGERHFRILKIARAPVPLKEDHLWLDKECSASEATVEAESLVDRIWRLNIIEDPHIYSKSELARLLHVIQATSRVRLQYRLRILVNIVPFHLSGMYYWIQQLCKNSSTLLFSFVRYYVLLSDPR